jgi:hypothetical protein
MAKSIDSPQFRSQRGRLGAYTRWANTDDRYMATRPAREAFYAKFEREVDPDGTLTPHERAKRADYARRAHMQRMALNSAKIRKIRKQICPECGGPKAAEQRICTNCWDKLPMPEL